MPVALNARSGTPWPDQGIGNQASSIPAKRASTACAGLTRMPSGSSYVDYFRAALPWSLHAQSRLLGPVPPDTFARRVPMSRPSMLLLIAWLLAMTATGSALFIGEVMGMVPCVLCW